MAVDQQGELMGLLGIPALRLRANGVEPASQLGLASVWSDKIRVLTVIDIFTRENHALHVARSIPSAVVTEVLEKIISERGQPEVIQVDNGSELTSNHFDVGSYLRGIQIDFIRPGKPVENAYIESFNGRLRDECLNTEWFSSLEDARRSINLWQQEYNTERPHSALGDLSPAEFAEQMQYPELTNVGPG